MAQCLLYTSGNLTAVIHVLVSSVTEKGLPPAAPESPAGATGFLSGPLKDALAANRQVRKPRRTQ